MNPNTLYEVHLASDVVSLDVERILLKLGFARDEFIGGTTGVVHPCHYTIDPVSLKESESIWNKCSSILQKADKSEFFGYGELEITGIGHKVNFDLKEFDSSVPLPVKRFEFEECPLDKHKAFDIHISVDLRNLDSQLRRIMEDTINFHYVDIRKSADRVVRVYTIQPLGSLVSPSIYYIFKDYLQKAGGFEGKIKLETVHSFARFPCTAPCCPVVTRVNIL